MVHMSSPYVSPRGLRDGYNSGKHSPYGGTSQFSSPGSRRRREDPSVCAIEARGHKEKLPRPTHDLADVYSDVEAEYVTSPRRTASSSSSFAREHSASSEFLWTTTSAVMLRPPELAASLPVPLAVVCTPFADTADRTSLPLSDPGPEQEPLRCTRCHAYANPFWKRVPRDPSRLQCNMCGHSVLLPEGFFDSAGHSEQAAEIDIHPELSYGSIDFSAPTHFDVDRPAGPCEPAVCFVLETSTCAVQSGFALSVLQTLEHVLEGPETSLFRKVCLVTFDDDVSVFARSRSGRFSRISVKEVDAPFVPVSCQAMLADLRSEGDRDAFKVLLQTLQESLVPVEPARTQSGAAAGSGLHIAADALTQIGGGDVLIFHASTPSLGIGALSNHSEKEPRKEKLVNPQQADFYQAMLALCTRGGVAVNSVTAPVPDAPLDVSTLQWLSWRTGGEVLHFPDVTQLSTSHLASTLVHWAEKMQGSAYGCVVRLRCSKGLCCKSLMATWLASPSSSDQSAFEVPRLSADTSVTFVLQPELEYDSNDDAGFSTQRDSRTHLYIQAAVLYTNARGERLLRVHTTALSVINSVRALYQSVSIAPLMTYLLKQAVSVSLERKSSSAVPPKELLLEFCLQVLATFRRYCHSSELSSRALVISKHLCLLPLYVLAARKLLYFIADGPDSKARDEHLQRLCRMPVHSIMVALYPRVYPIPTVLDEGLPEACPALQEHVTAGSSSAYLITNGFRAWFFQVEADGDEGQSSPAASEELRRNAEVLCERLRDALEPSPSWMPLCELPRLSKSTGLSWQDKVLLSALFVEDEGATEMSYADWCQFLHTHVLRIED